MMTGTKGIVLLLELPLVLVLVLQTKATPVADLKTVELANKYTIEVPANFSEHRLSSGTPQLAPSVLVAINFESDVNNKSTWFEVEVEQYGSNTIYVIDKNKPHFTISGGREVYYRREVFDNAYACTMNSKCPLPVEAESRYTTIYEFKFFDKPNNVMVTFTGSYIGASKEVTGFEGVGKVLRDVVVPSLAAIH